MSPAAARKLMQKPLYFAGGLLASLDPLPAAA